MRCNKKKKGGKTLPLIPNVNIIKQTTVFFFFCYHNFQSELFITKFMLSTQGNRKKSINVCKVHSRHNKEHGKVFLFLFFYL